MHYAGPAIGHGLRPTLAPKKPSTVPAHHRPDDQLTNSADRAKIPKRRADPTVSAFKRQTAHQTITRSSVRLAAALRSSTSQASRNAVKISPAESAICYWSSWPNPQPDQDGYDRAKHQPNIAKCQPRLGYTTSALTSTPNLTHRQVAKNDCHDRGWRDHKLYYATEECSLSH
jgi:hypothetical protein